MKLIFTAALIFHIILINAQPKPGDIFREYAWATPVNANEPFLRVCGDGLYGDATRKGENLFPPGFIEDGWFTMLHNIDLKDAVRAEVLVERMLCHDGSTGLAVKFNNGSWHKFPDAAGIPQPQSEYLYHYYPIVQVPLNELKSGENSNKFRFTLDKEQRWGMPQNMVYGMVVRIYYKNSKPHAETEISTLKDGDELGEQVLLKVKSNSAITKTEYIGLMENINYEGDGNYYQWHSTYHRGNLQNHIGTTATGELIWDTEWVPDQTKPIKIAARVTNSAGIIYMTKPVEKLQFNRSFHVELCKPYNIPKRWATREMEFVEAFDVKGNLTNAEKFLVTAVTWSPGYLNGVYLNDFLILDRESCKYCYHIIRKEFTETAFLSTMNGLKTGKTPLYNGKMQHGTEIQYPGFMVLVKYKKQKEKKLNVTETMYEGKSHFVIQTQSITWYFDKEGGGFSRMIDNDGNDWISFKREPWGEYPASAASAFRGIPNLVHQGSDSGAGHPGHAKCNSAIVGTKIITESKNGLWKWSWEFFDDYATLEVLQTDPSHPYWFLYEGTPGGKFAPSDYYFGTSTTFKRK